MTVKVFNYTDPGAPLHPNATLGSMAALLRACLVTGYSFQEDVTDSAGWDELFTEVNNYAAFQSLVGARQVFQVNDNMGDVDVAYMRAGESLSAVDASPVGEWGQDYFGKQHSAPYGKWHVIADERTAYVILESFYGHIVHGFGEFDSLVPNDPYNSFLSGHGTTSGLPATSDPDIVGLHYGTGLGSPERIHIHRSAIGTFSPTAAIVPMGDSHYPGGNTDQGDVSLANTGLGFYSLPIPLTCDAATENTLNIVRGKLRGVYNPLAYRPKDHLEEYVDEVTGKTMLCIHFAHGATTYRGCFMFDITGGW